MDGDVSNIQYEDRFVAFIDIIGWSAACATLTLEVRTALQLIHREAEDHSSAEKEQLVGDPHVQVNPLWLAIEAAVFLDNIAISMSGWMGGRILNSAANISRGLLQLGFLCRGDIAFGPLYHRESLIVGPALVQAAGLEKEASLPRILLTPEASAEIKRQHPEILANYLIEDTEGREILNPYVIGFGFPADHARLYRQAMEIEKVESVIAEGLHSAGEPSHREKWEYAKMMFKKMQAKALTLGAS